MALDVSSADSAVDPFHFVHRMLDRYRRDVHVLGPPASEDVLRSTERHLGQELPGTLAAFLRRWNGGSFFRGILLLRAASELAPPDEDNAALVVFADLTNGRRWAYAPDGQGDFVFGEVVDGRLRPLHDRFDRWLKATLRLMDEDAFDRETVVRRECDPDGGHLLLGAAEDALAVGDPEMAMEHLRRATAADPGNIRAWQRLGELYLAEADNAQARWALVRAARATRLPLPWPGAAAIEPGALRTLGTLFPAGDPGWERELTDLLERIHDIRDATGLALYQATALELGRVLRPRSAAAKALREALDRGRTFARNQLLPELQLTLANLEIDLGDHDAAEKHLRALLQANDARARLALARIIVARQEAWVDDALREASEGLTGAADRARLHLLEAERHLVAGHTDEAERALRAADPLAIASGDRTLQAAVCLGLGDVERQRGELEAAAVAYDRAEADADEELALRVELRRAELDLAWNQVDRAQARVQAAIEGFARLELPIREGWARLRLVRMGGEPRENLRRAFELFSDRAAGMAAGVGAVEALRGEPALSWHLERAAVSARERSDAQKCKAPLRRSDADRPERRLAAHRSAVATAGVEVVRALSQELDRRARELETAHARPADPNVHAYVAAADLLSHHRSFEAAQVMLSQLFSRNLPELPSRALRGAVTRSPNAALVDGLLEAVEQPRDTRSAVAAAEILGWRRETTAVEPLVRLLAQGRAQAIRRAAAVALGRIGDPAAVDPLAELVEEGEISEEVALALLLLGDRTGVQHFGDALTAGQDIGTAGEIVGRYGGPQYLLLLRGNARGEDARALASMQGLGYLGDVRGVPSLLEGLGAKDTQVVAVACAALDLLTGHREDPEEPGVHARWERWWEEHHADFREGLRYRYGEPWSPSLLARCLGHDEGLVRRGSYDELVIATGERLPFDADGPWRVQVTHQRAWIRWCRENAPRFDAGGWCFNGEAL